MLAVLARGGMGDIYLAAADGMDGFSKLLVIKELRREQSDDELYVNMFMDEARLAARLNHPNIVQTIEVDSDNERRFLVMEYLDGQSLQRALRRARRDGQPFSAELQVRVLTDVLEALAYSHELTDFGGSPLGIVHRDVSPQNVFITYEGQVKLIDFGIAKTRIASQQTSAGVLKGKIRYMAPEQATGQSVDHRTDIFSLGVMLWEALAGHGPWENLSDLQILQSLMSGTVPRLSERAPNLPVHLVAIADRAMSPAPEERYPTARAMRDDLLRSLRPAPGGGHANELRDLVSRLFANERRDLRAVVDAQLRGMGVDAPLQLVSLTRVRAQTLAGADAAALEPARSSRPSVAGTSSGAKNLGPASSRPSIGSPRGSSSLARRAAILAAVAIAGAVVLEAVRAERRRAAPVLSASTPAAGGPSAPPLAPETAARKTARLTVRALPQAAKIYVDDVLGENPEVAEFVRGDSVHQLRIEAPGYVAKTRTVTSATDVELEVSLDREQSHGHDAEPTAPRPSAASPNVAIDPLRTSPASPLRRIAEPARTTPTNLSQTVEATAPPRPADVHVPRGPAKREIDKEDPYAQ